LLRCASYTGDLGEIGVSSDQIDEGRANQIYFRGSRLDNIFFEEEIS